MSQTHHLGKTEFSALGETGSFKDLPGSPHHHGLCPFCGVIKFLNSTANYRPIFIASHADPDAVLLFECQGINTVISCFRICGTCGNVVRAAIKLLAGTSATWNHFLNSIIPNRCARREALSLSIVLTSQGKPLIELFRSIRDNQRAILLSSSNKTTPSTSAFGVGDKVSVEQRNRSSEKEDTGVGEVLHVEVKTTASTRSVFYSVRYNVDNRIESDLPESLLTGYSTLDDNKRRRVEECDDSNSSSSSSSSRPKFGNLSTRKPNQGYSELQERIRYLEAEVVRGRMQWNFVHANSDAANRT
jgi:hypothetical protein